VTKYTISYERKVQIRPYEMLGIGLTEEFDEPLITKDAAFYLVKKQVNQWIQEERARL